MTVIKVVDTVNKVYADQVIGLGGVFGVLVRYRYLEGVVVLFWILAGVLWLGFQIAGKRSEDGTDESREQTGTMDLAWLVCRFDSWMPGSGICPL